MAPLYAEPRIKASIKYVLIVSYAGTCSYTYSYHFSSLLNLLYGGRVQALANYASIILANNVSMLIAKHQI